MGEAKYYTVDNFLPEVEADFEARGTPCRNYGRLSRYHLDNLVKQDLKIEDLKKFKQHVLGSRANTRHWRLNQFLTNIAGRPGATYGEVSFEGYKLHVLDAGIADALGKGGGSDLSGTDADTFEGEALAYDAEINAIDGETENTRRREAAVPVEPDLHGKSTRFKKQRKLDMDSIKPYDSDVKSELRQWEGFEFWKNILGTSLVNLVPDRSFAIYVYARNLVGDDVPVYYFELQVDGQAERHYCIWELDQVLPQKDTHNHSAGIPHEGAKVAEYASAYQKFYFYMNWGENAPRKIEKAVVSDLPKLQQGDWSEHLEVLSEMRWSDAFISIVLLILTTMASVELKQYSISLVAGIVVAGIAAEEYIPPQTVIMGAIARFFANESLAMHMYFAANNSLSAKRVIITLLASVGELVDFFNGVELPDGLGGFLGGPKDLNIDEVCKTQLTIRGRQYCLGDVFLILATALNCLGLFQAAFCGVIGYFSHSAFPWKMWYKPKCYVEKKGLIRQTVMDCIPVEEFCSVYRPLLHWQVHADRRYLGTTIDFGSPGAPPSWICYFLCSPACSVIATKRVYGQIFRLNLIPLAIIEQLIALFGGLLILVLDFFVVLALFVNAVIFQTGLVSREFIRYLNNAALLLYAPAGLLNICVDFYYSLVAKALSLDTLYCRPRSTARLYRFPLTQRVRTGRASNHCWKFGDYLYDTAYYRCSDMVMVNPRYSKQGMMDNHRLLYKRHKLIWSSASGVRYENPCLSCGDNTTSRRDSFVGKVLKQQSEQHIQDTDGQENGAQRVDKQAKTNGNEREIEVSVRVKDTSGDEEMDV